MGDFVERIRYLRSITGKGLLRADVELDQVYARYQTGWGDLGDGSGTTGVITPTEESHGPAGKPGPLFDHPRGGEAGFLSATLTAEGPRIAEEWANAIGETPLVTTFIRQGEEIAGEAEGLAPIEVGILRGSASVKVVDDGADAYDRPALIPRITESALHHIEARKAWAGVTAQEEIEDLPEESK